MKIYAFIGPSGTGKSYRAQWIAREYGLECIIDDGLLIRQNKILAGKSAKKEPSKIASVKCAIFNNPIHANMVREAIYQYKPSGILILGTSDEMIEKIVAQLGLPEPEKKIYINEVATEKEMERARYFRREQGKHVIPVPTVEIKNQFSGYFLNPLKIFRRRDYETAVAEKTIVRPAFSYMGEYTISENVINSLVLNVVKSFSSIRRLTKVRNRNVYDGVIIDIEISCYYGVNFMSVMEELSKKVAAEVERITALNIVEMNVLVKEVYMEK
ncbi:MAG: Asp23/Gls24 family envelope stress response protein [Clostridia bacterium]|nr:Asp23/Gls24 family envelope stress response protein [Clostridia bacterium]